MELPVWFEIATFVGLSVLLLADLAIVARRPHEPSMKEASLWVSFYVALALIFGVVLLAVTNGTYATEFYAGWLTEYSLSVDNLFVFVIIMARFRVPRHLQQEALMVGIIIALGTTDLLFALDSIPAIFGLTREPFIVFTANVFALMGLRQLYFLLGGLLKRLVYLSLGLAVVLAFIGVKLVLEALHENSLPFINGGEHVEAVPTIPIWLSLSIILGVLLIATVASLLKTRGQLPDEDSGPGAPEVAPETAESVATGGPTAAAKAESRLTVEPEEETR